MADNVPLIFQKANLCKVGTTELSDHNRSELEIDYEELRTEHRTVTGKMRRYSLGYKKTFQLSWEFLPGDDANTVDGKAGRDSVKAFVEANTGTFTFSYRDKTGSLVNHTVFISDYNETLTKRWDDFYYNISLSMVEQ